MAAANASDPGASIFWVLDRWLWPASAAVEWFLDFLRGCRKPNVRHWLTLLKHQVTIRHALTGGCQRSRSQHFLGLGSLALACQRMLHGFLIFYPGSESLTLSFLARVKKSGNRSTRAGRGMPALGGSIFWAGLGGQLH